MSLVRTLPGLRKRCSSRPNSFAVRGTLYVLHGDFVSRKVHDEIAIAILGRAVVRFPLKPSKEGLDAGDQSLGAERFGDVVVGSQLQADDGVRFLCFGGQHDDGEHARSLEPIEGVYRLRCRRSQAASGRGRPNRASPVSLAGGLPYRSWPMTVRKPFFLHIQFDQLENVVLIFNDEDFLACRA